MVWKRNIILEITNLLMSPQIKAEQRDKMTDISQMPFSNAFSIMKFAVFWLKFQWNIFACVQFTIIQYWFKNGLATAIVWTNDGLAWWRTYASLGLNGLTHQGRVEYLSLSNVGATGSDKVSKAMLTYVTWTRMNQNFVKFQLKQDNFHSIIFESGCCLVPTSIFLITTIVMQEN